MRRETPHHAREASEITQLSPERHAGEAMYAGQLIPHFGHFLLEGTSRLWWALKNDFQGTIVFDARGPGGLKAPFVRRFLEMTGLLDRTVVVTKPLQFARVFVPHPSFRLTTEIHREMLRPFATAYRALDPHQEESGGRPVYLSRSGMENGVVMGEHLVEQALEQEGFRVVHPERLLLDRQIATVVAAPIVVGILGSALHTMLFAPEPKRAVYLRREGRTTANYVMIDQLLGNRSSYLIGVMNSTLGEPEGVPQLLDVEKTLDMLQSLGLLQAAKRVKVDLAALQASYRQACAAYRDRTGILAR
jgi:capsular polysaccharide biosynthesis protein